MPYTMTVWKNDEDPPISAENLNHMENGIFNATETAERALNESSSANDSAANAAISAQNAADAASLSAKQAADSAANAMSGTPDGYADLAKTFNALNLYVDEDGDVCQKEES